MKILKTALLAACIFLFAYSLALSEGFYASGNEIVFAESCPEGYREIGDTLSLGKGETRAIVSYAKYFASRNHNVASIDNEGVLCAQNPGVTTVSVYLEDNIRKDLIVEVGYAPKSIKLSEKKGTLRVGETYPLKATLTKSTISTITWTSSAPDIVTVDETGRLTAHAVGECVITARTHNGLTAECAVTVKMPAPAKIDLFTDEMILYLGESAAVSYTLEGGWQETIFWSSGDEAIASVDQNGVITAKNIGHTVICLEASGGDVRFVDVTVEEGSSLITFPASELTLYVGGRTIFEPTIEGGSGKYEFVSMDPSIASIDPETGEICALVTGSVYILAVTPNFTFGEFLLTIIDGPEALTLTPDKNEIMLGEVIYTSNNLGDYDPQFTWYESTDNDIAHVDEYGVVTGTGKGTAVISVHSAGLVGKTEITVLPPAEGINAWAARDHLGAGETTECLHTLIGGTGSVEYHSSDVHVAQVDGETGTLYALNPGACEITVTVSSGAKTVFPVTVSPAPQSVYTETSSITLATVDRRAFAFGVNEGAMASFTVLTSDPELVWYENGYLYSGSETGTAIVTVKTHNNLTASCDVTVVPSPEEIIVNAQHLSINPDFDYFILLEKDVSHSLSAYADGFPDIEISYSSSHPDIADVTEDGLIRARKEGTSLITVSLFSGLEARVLVSVS